MMPTIVHLFFAFTFLFNVTAGVQAARAIDQVKATADRVIALLNDPALQGDDKKAERHRLIRQELDARFDWPEIARGCLGRHWSKRNNDERKEFMALFSEFLERTYLDRIEPYYADLEKLDFLGEKIIDNYASVKTVISTKKKIDHPVEYRLQKTGDEWRVYDVVIEGVSLVKNYRVQFDEIIAKSSYESLIKDIKSKIQTGTD